MAFAECLPFAEWLPVPCWHGCGQLCSQICMPSKSPGTRPTNSEVDVAPDSLYCPANAEHLPNLCDIVAKSLARALKDPGPGPPSPIGKPHQRAVGLESWCDGNPESFRLRCGPNYRRNALKAPPGRALYNCVGVDIVQAPHQISAAILSLNAGMSAPTSSAGPLPQIIAVNFQIPFQVGPVAGDHPRNDHGCSMLIYFRIDASVAAEAQDLNSASPGVRLLAEYLSEEGHPFRENRFQSKCLKAVGILMNIESMNFPAVLAPIIRKFNGKPVLVERETRRHELNKDIVELAIDIRGFNPVARVCLSRVHEQLRRADIQIGLTIQGCSDAELPEQLLGVVRFSGLDIMSGVHVQPHAALVGEQAETQRCGVDDTSVGRLKQCTKGFVVSSLCSLAALYLWMLFRNSTTSIFM